MLARVAAASDPLSDLIARLYAGIDATSPWEDFLAGLAHYLGSAFATLIITAPGLAAPGTFVTPGADRGLSRSYLERFFRDDPFRDLPDGRVISFAEFIAGRGPERFAGYREYLREAGGEQVLAVDLRFPGGFEARFRATRTAGHPDFSAADRARFQALVPHLRGAVALFEKLQFAEAQHAVFRSATAALGMALLVLDRGQRLVSANALAERLLGEGEGIRIARGVVRFDSAALRAKIAALVQPGQAIARVSRFRIARPAHGDLIATARVIELPTIYAGAGALALFLARPGEDLALEPDAIRDLLGVTRAEARLCAALAQGDSLAAAARRLGIAHNTAKAQLRAVFVKTQVHRQAQLVQLLGALTG